MKDSFERSLAFVLSLEGGYTNHPNDRGGVTNKGILQREYDAWRKKQDLPEQDVKNLSNEEVYLIYRENYWVPGKCEQLPWPVCLVHFDACVNTGVYQAAKFLQRAVRSKDDGIIGPKTLKAVEDEIEESGTEGLTHCLLEQRKGFYDIIVSARPSQRSFINGWQNRITKIQTHIA
jgi:lysozyme family protein